jgi:F-type H+-transporting ATPase subunit b
MIEISGNFIIVFILVWVLLAVLTKVYFNPVRKVMKKRDSEIGRDRNAGEKADEDHDKIIQKIEDDIKEARMVSQKTRDTFISDAQKEKDSMLDEISKECRTQVDDAKAELNKQLEDLKKDLEAKGKKLAEQIEERLLP